MKIVYVAGRFTGKTAWEIAENVRAAERVGLEVARLGAMPLIPHANTAHFHGEGSAEFWYAGTLELLRRSDAIVMVPGWEASKSAVQERAEAISLGIPVFTAVYTTEGWQLGDLLRWISGPTETELRRFVVAERE
jgi:hypothetical protein